MSTASHLRPPLRPQHIWKFIRTGGLDQVRLESGEDLLALERLDPKLWVALTCPTRGLEFDARTLELIDTDRDGRLRVPEILAAVRWATQHLKDPAHLLHQSESLPLSAINDQLPSGGRLLASARQILAQLGKPNAAAISVADTTDTARIFAQTRFNGDGIIPPESAEDPEARQLITDIIATLGGQPDRNGSPGINQALLDQFFWELQQYLDWWQSSVSAPANPASSAAPVASPILCLGETTAPAWEALEALREKVADYFARCRLAAFDARATGPLNRDETEFTALAAKSLAGYGPEVSSLPLARIEAGQALPLTTGANPAWSEALARFRQFVVGPLLGPAKGTLTEAEWQLLQERFRPYADWRAAQPNTAVEKLGRERLRQIRAGGGREQVLRLIAQDMALAPQMAEIAAVDRLVRYCRDLHPLLNNFVTFDDFYSGDRRAVFQAGTLYLDGRSCELCVWVEDVEKHAAMASLGRIFLVYCELHRADVAARRLVAAAFTSGTGERLVAGRNGLFYDRQGRDWDATVVKVLEHPMSLQEAVWSPFKRLARFIGEQFEKIALAKEQALQTTMGKEIQQLDPKTGLLVPAAPAVPATPTPPAGIGGGIGPLIGLLAGGGVAVAALGSAFTAIAKMLSTMSTRHIIITLLSLFAIISGPSVLVAWFKLRARDLGPVLEAAGWAINLRIKLTLPLGRALTKLSSLPLGSIQSLDDLYPEKLPKSWRWLWTLLLLALLAVVASYVWRF